MGVLGLILLICVVAVVLKIFDIGGKPAQLVWLIVCVLVVLWLLDATGVWTGAGRLYR